jgi:phosphotransferase system enzyme I (PtsI)
MDKMMKLDGKPVSEGYAVGPVYMMEKVTDCQVIHAYGEVEQELNRFHQAIEKSLEDLNHLYKKMLEKHGESEAKIFEAHREMLSDVEMIHQIEDEIRRTKCCAEWAVKIVGDQFVTLFEEMENPYFRERALDIQDIINRLIKNLVGQEDEHLLSVPSIVVAKDLTPSETCLLDKDMVLGIITEKGGQTSHSAIIARMLNIPYIVLPGILDDIDMNMELAMSGSDGQLIIHPSDDIINEFKELMQAQSQEQERYKTVKGLESISLDGQLIVMKANIGSLEDMDQVLMSDAQGIGLFRTEFMYMNRKMLPTFEEQVKIYSEIIEKMKGKPVTFRTLDIGGDKKSDLFNIPEEMNPFLGYRGIRLCLEERDLFKTQLKAILVSALKGFAKIMFPMITSIQELWQAKDLLSEAQKELEMEAIEYSKKVPVGMMIETPSSVMMADLFAKEVDFFSIGTNDLTQYTLATDRMNPKVAYLYSGYDPALLRSIQKVTAAAKLENIDVSICGELAADINLLGFWVDCGMDSLSMSASSIEKVKWYIRHSDISKAKDLLEKVDEMRSEKQMHELMQEITKNIFQSP